MQPVVESMGYELVGVEHTGNVLRVYIDSEDGVTVDDCARVSHQVSGLLDVEDPIPGNYNLEVSSPGLDRPLFRAADYERFAGRRARIRLHAPRDGRRKFAGVLVGMEGDAVVIEQDGEKVRLPLAQIDQARLEPDL